MTTYRSIGRYFAPCRTKGFYRVFDVDSCSSCKTPVEGLHAQVVMAANSRPLLEQGLAQSEEVQRGTVVLPSGGSSILVCETCALQHHTTETEPMDPDTALATFLRACRLWNEGDAADSDSHRKEATQALTDLRTWISNGGFLPHANEAAAVEWKKEAPANHFNIQDTKGGGVATITVFADGTMTTSISQAAEIQDEHEFLLEAKRIVRWLLDTGLDSIERIDGSFIRKADR